ncbi:MAG: DUF1304 family protein [Nocardioides sp.]
MKVVATVLIALVALIHGYIVVLEMVLWTAPRTRAAFGTSAELAEQTKVLAANQGSTTASSPPAWCGAWSARSTCASASPCSSCCA